MINQSFDHQTWEKALEHLRSDVDDESYATWLRPARFEAASHTRVTLSVPNAFYKSWLLSNYHDRIVRALRDVTSRDYELELRVGDGAVPESMNSSATDAGSAPMAAAEIEQFKSYLNPKYTFDNFVVGESNRFAHAACRQVAEPASKSYNPLFLYGGVGLGKTHLMHAIGHQILQMNPSLRVRYVSSEAFMNSFIESISQGKQLEFRSLYRNVDLLMIDDVQFFSGKESTQTEFFHTFNELHDSGKRIVISSDRPPRELTTLEDRLRNRFSWGLVVDIQPPDLETRVAILKRKALAVGVELTSDVTVYIAERIQSNIRELEGVLVRLKAYSVVRKEPMNLQFAKSVLDHLLVDEMPQTVDVDDIIETVCNYFDLKRSDLIGTSRLKKFAVPRHIAQYLSRNLTPLSYPEIAAKFGGRDHTSVLHAVKKITEDMEKDQNLKSLIGHLSRRIRQQRTPITM